MYYPWNGLSFEYVCRSSDSPYPFQQEPRIRSFTSFPHYHRVGGPCACARRWSRLDQCGVQLCWVSFAGEKKKNLFSWSEIFCSLQLYCWLCFHDCVSWNPFGRDLSSKPAWAYWWNLFGCPWMCGWNHRDCEPLCWQLMQ